MKTDPHDELPLKFKTPVMYEMLIIVISSPCEKRNAMISAVIEQKYG